MNGLMFWRRKHKEVTLDLKCPHGKEPSEPCTPCDEQIRRRFGVEVHNPLAHLDEGSE